MGYKKYAKTQGSLMLKFFNTNKINFLQKLELILSKRKLTNKANQAKFEKFYLM